MKLKEFFVQATLEYDKKDYDKFNTAVENAGRNMKKFGFAIGAAVGTLFGLSKITASNSRELDINARSLGLNVERLQELEYAASLAADVNRGELNGALQSLTSTLHNVRMGNIHAADSFAQLQIGSSILADENLRVDQVLAMVSERLRLIQDPIRKAALAQEIFGGAGAKLIPLLDRGAEGIAALGKEARGLGAVLSRDAIVRGVEFDRTMDKIAKTLKGVVHVVGTELFKAFGPSLKILQKYVAENRKLIALKVKEFVKGLIIFLKLAWKVIGFLIDRMKIIIELFGGFESFITKAGGALAIFFGAKMLASVGALVMALRPLALIMGIISFKALAIGAGIAALYLIIEDFVVFMQGGNSVIGQMFDKMGPVMTDLGQKIGESLVSGFSSLETWFISFFTETVPGLAAELPGMIKDKLLGVADFGSKMADKASSFGSSLVGGAKSLLGFGGESASPMGSVANNNSNSQANTINAPITVTVPTGTSPTDATNIVSKGVESGFDAILRQTRNDFTGGVAR